MNSLERHDLRYQRRRQKRLKNQLDANVVYDDVFSFGSMYKRGKECCEDVRWKTSTNNFEIFLVQNVAKKKKEIENNTYESKGFSHFITVEHGKERQIASLKIEDRLVQKSLNQDCLLPIFARTFVEENSASLENKGMDWTIKRLKKNLSEHYRKYGLEGGIYQFDFKNYFGSIPHEQLKNMIISKVKDEKLSNLLCQLIDDFQTLRTIIVDENGKYHGVGLGSEVSQTFALAYVNSIDHYVKDKIGIHGYGRYMDDGYIISNSLKELEEIKKTLFKMAEELGVQMSVKKNIITPFKNHSFVFLKFRVRLQKNGKITIKLSRNSIKSIRRKLKFFRKQIDENKMSFDDVASSYQAWRAHAKRANSYNTLKNLDKYFVDLFKEELGNWRIRFKCTLKSYKKDGKWVYINR